jgi:hypothetical protein
MALCRRHHRIKQRDGWSVRLDADGTATWTDPSGALHTTAAVDHLHLGATAPDQALDQARDGTPTSAPAPTARTRHVDLGLLDAHLTEHLTDHLAEAARRRRHGRQRPAPRRGPFAVGPDHHAENPWATVHIDLPPREARPDVIPF